MYEGVRNLPSPRDPEAAIVGRVEDGAIVVRAVRPGDDEGFVVYSFDWKYHLHRTEVHETVLQLIADATACAIRSARDRGHAMSLAEVRDFLGVK